MQGRNTDGRGVHPWTVWSKRALPLFSPGVPLRMGGWQTSCASALNRNSGAIRTLKGGDPISPSACPAASLFVVLFLWGRFLDFPASISYFWWQLFVTVLGERRRLPASLFVYPHLFLALSVVHRVYFVLCSRSEQQSKRTGHKVCTFAFRSLALSSKTHDPAIYSGFLRFYTAEKGTANSLAHGGCKSNREKASLLYTGIDHYQRHYIQSRFCVFGLRVRELRRCGTENPSSGWLREKRTAHQYICGACVVYLSWPLC